LPHRIEKRLKIISHYPRTIALFIGVIVIVAIIYDVADRANKNKLAIEKGCILLNNAIIKSSASQTDPHSPSVPLIQGILATIPKKYVDEYLVRSRQNPTVVPLIDCKKVADHPGDIKAEQIPTPPPRQVQK